MIIYLWCLQREDKKKTATPASLGGAVCPFRNLLMWAGPLVCVAADGTVLHHPVLTAKAQFGSAVSCLFSPNEPSPLLICTESCCHRRAVGPQRVKRRCWWLNKCLNLTKLLCSLLQ